MIIRMRNKVARVKVSSRRSTLAVCALSGLLMAGVTSAGMEHGDSEPTLPDPKTTYSPYLQDTFPNQVLFGDTHSHTALSADAGFFLNRLMPDDSYRFAKGETVTSSTGVPAKIVRPLDFLVVSDHAETFGLAIAIREQHPALSKTEWGRKLLELAAPDYNNSIGAPLLSGYWSDPDFDPEQHAFYYVRVLEIPTPNWTTYDHVYLGVDLSEKAVPYQQERAYTSPIWYTP